MRKILVSFLLILAAAAGVWPAALSFGGSLWVSHDLGSLEGIISLAGGEAADFGGEFSYIDSGSFRLFQTLRGDFSLFGAKLRSLSLRSEIGFDLFALPFLFAEAAGGLGYMHSWQTEVYIALPGSGLGAGMDWGGLASIFPCARLGLGARVPAGSDSFDIVLSYEYLFRLSPWSGWSNTHMNSLRLFLRWNIPQGGSR